MNDIFQNLNLGILESRLILVSVFIFVNLVISVIDAIKSHSFSFKKLPNFINEWLLSCAAVSILEVVITLVSDSKYAYDLLIIVREISLLSILACYGNKTYESLKNMGWMIDISKGKALYDKKNEILNSVKDDSKLNK